MLPPTWLAAWMNQSRAKTGSRRMLRASATSIVTEPQSRGPGRAREAGLGTRDVGRGISGAAPQAGARALATEFEPARGPGRRGGRGLSVYKGVRNARNVHSGCQVGSKLH